MPSYCGCGERAARLMDRAIILTSFGVREHTDRMASLEKLEQEAAESFPDFMVRQVYTSDFIRKCIFSEQHIYMPSLSECLDELQSHEIREVFIQPVYFMSGFEYMQKVVQVAESYRDSFSVLTVGLPLFGDGLSDKEYLDILLAACNSYSLSTQEQFVMVGHGSNQGNSYVYEKLQQIADSAGLPVHIGVLEENDKPGFDEVSQRLDKAEVQKVLLVPFLFSAGCHVLRDIAGDAPSTWKSRLLHQEIRVRCIMTGLGSQKEFRRIYLERIAALVEKNHTCHT